MHKLVYACVCFKFGMSNVLPISIKIGLEHIENRKSHINPDNLPIQGKKSCHPKAI